MNTPSNINLAPIIADLNLHLRGMQQCFVQLAALLEPGSDADYWREADQHRRGQSARRAALAFIKTWWYQTAELPMPRYGLIYASAQALAVVGKINALKSAFQLGHERAAQHVVEGERPALLAEIKRGLLVEFDGPINLDAIDRKIPVFDQPVVSASWYQESSYSSTRRCVADAIEELKQRISDAQGTAFADVLTADLVSLHALPQDMVLCHRPKAKVRGQYCRLKFVSGTQRGQRKKCWAINPIFVASHPSIEAHLEWRDPDQKTQNNSSKPAGVGIGAGGKGHARKLYAQPITPNMAHWHAYLPEPTQPESKKPTKRKAQNPHAKTAYPGIWIGIRWRKTNMEVSLRFIRHEQRDSAVSLGQRSLSQAWQLAVAKHLASFSDASLAPSEHTLLALCPEQQQVERAIEWFASNK